MSSCRGGFFDRLFAFPETHPYSCLCTFCASKSALWDPQPSTPSIPLVRGAAWHRADWGGWWPGYNVGVQGRVQCGKVSGRGDMVDIGPLPFTSTCTYHSPLSYTLMPPGLHSIPYTLDPYHVTARNMDTILIVLV